MFYENSFGFRTNHECHQALRQVLQYNQKGYNKVAEGFSDDIDYDIIIEFTISKIAYGNGLDIIKSFLRSGLFVRYTNGILIMCKTSFEIDTLKFMSEKSKKKYENSLHIFNTVKRNLENEVFEK